MLFSKSVVSHCFGDVQRKRLLYCCLPLNFLCPSGNRLESERNGKIIKKWGFICAEAHPTLPSPAGYLSCSAACNLWFNGHAAVSRTEVLWWDWKSSSVCAACTAAEPRALCWGRATTATKLPATLPVRDRFPRTLPALRGWHYPWPAGNPLPKAAQETIGLLCHEGTCLAHGQPGVQQDPQVLLCKAAFQPVGPQPVLVHEGFFSSLYRILHFQLLNFIRLLLTCFSILSRSLWTAAQPSGVSTAPPNFIPFSNLLREHSFLSPRSVMKRLNSIGPSINPWGTPLFQLRHVSHGVVTLPRCTLLWPPGWRPDSEQWTAVFKRANLGRITRRHGQSTPHIHWEPELLLKRRDRGSHCLHSKSGWDHRGWGM